MVHNFKDIHFFPHTRFSKDVHFRELEFDGIASYDTQLVLFQTKSNVRPSKKIIAQYHKIASESSIICLWLVWRDRQGMEIYGNWPKSVSKVPQNDQEVNLTRGVA